MPSFPLKDDGAQSVQVTAADLDEIVPDADFRFSLLVLKDGRKVFVAGTRQEIEDRLKEDNQ